MVRLFVNVDHVATIREARKTTEPDPLKAALLAEQAGAHGITVHLREDRRHIQDHDVTTIAGGITTPLNLEMAAVPEMVDLAAEIKPYQVSIVPEKRQEITTEGGLDVCSQEPHLRQIRDRLAPLGVRVSLFIDPDSSQIVAAKRVGAVSVEFNTGPYTELKQASRIEAALESIRSGAEQASGMGLRVFAGHGLNAENVVLVAAIPQIEELNIGHHLLAQSVYVGFEQSVRDMIQAIEKGVKMRKTSYFSTNL